ncbi:MAG TPA: NAD-dependent epimerase/dehydratase family protein [Gemmataceae bacterium]|nr:NAD-dependent epimerase/dehydratase family protein [Gemmataceae bacterium]
MKRNVITGATGLLGSHIAERLIQQGEQVRALVRPSSDTAFLKSLGVELAVGDLDDPDSIRKAVGGADVVYHCAARVGEWGPWRAFREGIIEPAERVFDACRGAGVGRLLHVSSIAVYGHPRERADLFTEDEPLGQKLWFRDYYRRAKIQAEELCRAYPGDWTIIRPSWIYGPRDRTSLPRVFKALRAGRVAIIGRGDNLLNIIYAADVAEGAVLAAEHPGAVGRAYNLSSDGELTQQQFLDILTDALGRSRVSRRVPFRIAFWGAFFGEIIAHLIRMRRSPYITRYAVSLVGRSTRYSTDRARMELGWRPRTPALEGLRRTLEWYSGLVQAGAA